jgi:hypothetical protein
MPSGDRYLSQGGGLSNSAALHPANWSTTSSVIDWLSELLQPTTPNAPALHTLAILVLWTIWKERNQRVFRNGENSLASLFTVLRDDARTGFWRAKSFSCCFTASRVVSLVLCLDDRSVHLGAGLCAACARKTLFLLLIYAGNLSRSFKKK